MARFFIQSRLSKRLSVTPEGYLLCQAVPIARTGSLEYLPEEVPVAVDPGQKVVTVYRLAEDLFSPAALASFEGKPFTIGHPDEDVGPGNWRDLAVGHVQNVRRGDDAEADLLLADILVTDQEAIDLIQSEELREISIGYDAEYEDVAPGVGKQINIIGNHTALVDVGRAGPRCAVRDAKPKESSAMKVPKKSFLDRLMGNPKARRAVDEAMAEAAKDEDPQPAPAQKPEEQPVTDSDDQAANIAEILLIVRSISETLQAGRDEDPQPAQDEDPDAAGDEDPDATQDEDPIQAQDEDPQPGKPAQDRARVRGADAATVERANILYPGLRARVGDAAVAVKRAALRQGMRDQAVKRTVDEVLRGRSVDKVDALTLDAAFAAAAAVARVRNNASTADALLTRQTRDHGSNRADTPADLNTMFVAHRAALEGKK